MIGAEHCVNGMKSLHPPMLQSGPIKIRIEHVPACCYQIINSLFNRHWRFFLSRRLDRGTIVNTEAP